MIDARRVRSKALRALVKTGDESKIKPEWLPKVKRLLAALNVAVHPSELDLPGFGFHKLQGDREGTYSLTVSQNWRITFRMDDRGPYDVDLEDYHGR